MKKSGFILLVTFAMLLGNTVAKALPAQWAFRITFTDKNGTLPFDNPLAFLSQRALDRRMAQGIGIDSLDLPVSPAYIDSVLTLTNGVFHLKSKWLNECVILLDDSSQILNLQNKPYISSIKWIAYYASGLHAKPGHNNPKFEIENQPAGKATGQPSFYDLTWNQVHQVNGDCMHDSGYMGQGVLIALLDAGYIEANTHFVLDSLRQSGRLLDTFDFVLHDDFVYTGSYHGAQCLSTIAGYIPDSFVGTAPLAQFALFRTEDDFSEQAIEMDNLVAGAERADSLGADVISVSLGYSTFDAPANVGNDLTYADLDGVSTIAVRGANIATKKGIVFVNAAGNQGGNAWHYLMTPSDGDSVICVGAVDGSGNPAGFSSYGPNAAGVIKPDVSARGVSTAILGGGNTLGTGSGTSFATPQMAGWAACLVQAAPGVRPWLIRKALDSSADHYLNPGAQIGYGIPDICLAKDIINGLNTPPQQWAFRVSFTDKNGTLPLNNPLAFLSQRAIDRRTTYGIAIDSADLPVSPAYVRNVLTLTAGVLHTTSKWYNNCVILLKDSSQIVNLQNIPYISSVTYVAHYDSSLHYKQSGNPKFAAEHGMQHKGTKATGQPSYYNQTWTQTHLVNGDCLHDQGFKGQGKLIAVLDQGFTEANMHFGFDSLMQSGRLIDSFNFVFHMDSVFRISYHGTEALSTMAGYIPDSFVGSAPLAEYALYLTEDIRTEQPIELDNMEAGMERADSIGADIISSSLGYNTFDAPFTSFTYADLDGKTTSVTQATNLATTKGILCVISAGNEGTTAWHNILTPGDADSALTVGAVNSSGIPASFSGYGPNAAGVTKPDVCAQGVATMVFLPGNDFGPYDGTSFAVPQIAGWAACLMQYAPSPATPYQIRMAIDSSADHFTNPGTQLGYGVPDICAASLVIFDPNHVSAAPLTQQAWMDIYPTLFHSGDDIRIEINSSVQQTVSFVLTDLRGAILTSFSKEVPRGNSNQYWKTPPYLSAGMYILQAVSADGKVQKKLVKY